MEQDQVERRMNVLIRPNVTDGTSIVEMRYPAILRTSCIMKVRYFPFDSQHCTLTFGSWTYDNHHIDYIAVQKNVTLKYLVINQEWDIAAFYSERIITKYDCCEAPYTMIMYHIVIQRKPLFYIINLIIPTVLVAMINFIGFFTPSSSNGDRNEKISLGLTTLLAMGVLLLQIVDSLPHSSKELPLIGEFILEIIILVGAGIIMTVLITHLHLKGLIGSDPNQGLRYFLRLCDILTYPIDIICAPCTNRQKAFCKKQIIMATHPEKSNEEERIDEVHEHQNQNETMKILEHVINNNNNFNTDNSFQNQHPQIHKRSTTRTSHLEDVVLHELVRLRGLIDKIGQEDHHTQANENDNEWIHASAALERVCLVVFLCAIAICVALCLCRGYGNMIIQ